MSIEYTDKNVPFINLGDGYQIRLEYESVLEEKYAEKAKNELRETPDVVANAITEFREMIKSESISILFYDSIYIPYAKQLNVREKSQLNHL